VSDWCWIARRSPWAAAFPPPPPPRVAPLGSAASLVLRGGPTPAARTRPPFGFAPSLTGLFASQARHRSPGSRACCFSTCAGSSTTPRPAQARDVSPAADVAFHLCKQGRHAVRQFSGLNRPAHRCLYLRFAVRPTTYHARLKVRIESLLLFCRALSSLTTCRFIPAHSHPCVALSSYQASPLYGSFSNRKRQDHAFRKKTAPNPGGFGGCVREDLVNLLIERNRLG